MTDREFKIQIDPSPTSMKPPIVKTPSRKILKPSPYRDVDLKMVKTWKRGDAPKDQANPRALYRRKIKESISTTNSQDIKIQQDNTYAHQLQHMEDNLPKIQTTTNKAETQKYLKSREK